MTDMKVGDYIKVHHEAEGSERRAVIDTDRVFIVTAIERNIVHFIDQANNQRYRPIHHYRTIKYEKALKNDSVTIKKSIEANKNWGIF